MRGIDGMGDINERICFTPIGIIRTPYKDWAPHQPVEREEEQEGFSLLVFDEYSKGLKDLDRFAYIHVLYFCDRVKKSPTMVVSPPWTSGKSVGLFAARSPARPNPIGLSIVRPIRIGSNEITISPIDAFDETPLLDIKPYFKDLDAKEDANCGWADDLEAREHLMLHLRGPRHEY